MSSDLDEITHTLRELHRELEDLTVGGLRTLGPERVPVLERLSDEMSRIGAAHLSSRLATLAAAIRDDDRRAAPALMRAEASLRLFERVLTLETVEAALAAACDAEDDGEDEAS